MGQCLKCISLAMEDGAVARMCLRVQDVRLAVALLFCYVTQFAACMRVATLSMSGQSDATQVTRIRVQFMVNLQNNGV